MTFLVENINPVKRKIYHTCVSLLAIQWSSLPGIVWSCCWLIEFNIVIFAIESFGIWNLDQDTLIECYIGKRMSSWAVSFLFILFYLVFLKYVLFKYIRYLGTPATVPFFRKHVFLFGIYQVEPCYGTSATHSISL